MASVETERWKKGLPDWNRSESRNVKQFITLWFPPHLYLSCCEIPSSLLSQTLPLSLLSRFPQRRAGSCSASLTSSSCCQLWNLLLIYSTPEKHLTKERNDTALEGKYFYFFLPGQKLSQEIVLSAMDKMKYR